MIVALTSDAMYLKDELIRRGHRVVSAEMYRGAIDAVVYKGSVSGVNLCSSNFSGHSGVLAVDCTGKSAISIDHYLKYRSFSSIF